MNAVAWKELRVTQMDWKWNYIVMADWLIQSFKLKYPWTENRSLARMAKTTLSVRLLASFFLSSPIRVVTKLRASYTVHLTWFRMGAGIVHRVLG